jgi:uncharacterized membrane protein
MKKLKITNPFWQVLGIGALAGMRSSAAPVITSHILSHHRSKLLGKSSLRFMQSAKVATALKTMAISEMIMDKMPTAPNRIAVTGLFARGLSGAVAGASIYKATGGNAWLGAALGSAAAIVSTFGSFYLRKDAVEKTHWLDPIVGAIEDALVIGAGVALVKIDE